MVMVDLKGVVAAELEGHNDGESECNGESIL